MAKRVREPEPESVEPDLIVAAAGDRLQSPLAVVLGSPRQAAELASSLDAHDEATCFQLDIHQAERVREELKTLGSAAKVETLPDLWDIAGDFPTAVYPAQRGGERSLKIDMIEQTFHVLRPRGRLIVLSDYPDDQFFPGQLKKIYRRVHTPDAGEGRVMWCQRDGDRPRRRHEMTFHARIGDNPSLRFLSRPGVFSYGRFDEGARALMEVVYEHQIARPGTRVLDVGCGCGTNGIFAGHWSGPTGRVTFVDSNVRALAMTEHNAKLNGLSNYKLLASSTLDRLDIRGFDVVLANPPYYAHHAIAELFIRRSRPLLTAGGRLYLVTKQPDALGPMLADVFGRAEVAERRGYVVLWGTVARGND
ncbi:MAG: methyltransferase [Gemmataceae bacterium]|nr:methyltransferase [Gemmataceae bacterium]